MLEVKPFMYARGEVLRRSRSRKQLIALESPRKLIKREAPRHGQDKRKKGIPSPGRGVQR